MTGAAGRIGRGISGAGVGSARLSVERPYDAGGILRRLFVEVDGERIAALKQQRSVDVELTPGRHTVVADMDWAAPSRLDVDLAEGEHLRLEAALPLSPMWETITGRRRALSIRRL